MTQSPALLAALAAVLFGVYRYLIYPTLFCPMRRIPTLHCTSRYSSLALLWIRYWGQENRTVYKLHKQKGPILRLAPNMLSLNCFDGGLKQIYLGGFPKSKFYPKGFINYGVLPLFAMMNNKEHAKRKRMFANVFSKTHIICSASAREVTKAMLFDRLLPLIQNKITKNEPLDVVPLNYAYSMDSFVNWQFGLSCGSNLIQNEEERNMYLSGFFDRERYSFEAIEIPTITWLLECIGIRIIPRSVNTGTENIENWNMAMCDKAEELLRTKSDIAPVDYPTVFAQAVRGMGKESNEKTQNRGKEKYPNRTDIACEMFSDSSAAHETSGVTLTYLMYELSKRPEMQARLRAELMGLDPPPRFTNSFDDAQRQLPDAKDVLELPLLDAVVMETLRLYPAVPGGQPRSTPNAVNSLGGIDNIPASVEVQCYAYTMHRNQEVFPDPESWKPERWIEASPEQLTAMRRWFWAFGSGASMCIGSNFAMYSMKFCIAAIYANFMSEVHSHGDMELMDAYLAGPKGGRLELKFAIREP